MTEKRVSILAQTGVNWTRIVPYTGLSFVYDGSQPVEVGQKTVSAVRLRVSRRVYRSFHEGCFVCNVPWPRYKHRVLTERVLSQFKHDLINFSILHDFCYVLTMF